MRARPPPLSLHNTACEGNGWVHGLWSVVCGLWVPGRADALPACSGAALVEALRSGEVQQQEAGEDDALDDIDEHHVQEEHQRHPQVPAARLVDAVDEVGRRALSAVRVANRRDPEVERDHGGGRDVEHLNEGAVRRRGGSFSVFLSPSLSFSLCPSRSLARWLAARALGKSRQSGSSSMISK